MALRNWRKPGLAAILAIGSWAAAYTYITDCTSRSSSIVKQTLFNLQIDPQSKTILGSPIKVTSKVQGEMNQIKGLADVSFSCSGPKGISIVLAKYVV